MQVELGNNQKHSWTKNVLILGLLMTLHNRFFMDRCAGGILDNTLEVAEDPRPMLRPLETVGRGR